MNASTGSSGLARGAVDTVAAAPIEGLEVTGADGVNGEVLMAFFRAAEAAAGPPTYTSPRRGRRGAAERFSKLFSSPLPIRRGPCKIPDVPRSDMPTMKISPAPVVLAIGCSPELVRRITDAAIAGQALVVECEVQNAATQAAQTRALVLVLLEEVYSFDGASFNALAADVRARVVVLPNDQVPPVELESMIVGAIIEAEASRDSFI
jgi:hypothetical protein